MHGHIDDDIEQQSQQDKDHAKDDLQIQITDSHVDSNGDIWKVSGVTGQRKFLDNVAGDGAIPDDDASDADLRTVGSQFAEADRLGNYEYAMGQYLLGYTDGYGIAAKWLDDARSQQCVGCYAIPNLGETGDDL